MLFAGWSLRIQRGSWESRALRPSGSLCLITDEALLVSPSFVTTNCALQFSSRGIRPGLTTVLARHLDKNTMGYLQWRWGIQSAMNTSIVRDTKTSHFTVALQVRTPWLGAGDNNTSPWERSAPAFPAQPCFGLGREDNRAVGTGWYEHLTAEPSTLHPALSYREWISSDEGQDAQRGLQRLQAVMSEWQALLCVLCRSKDKNGNLGIFSGG